MTFDAIGAAVGLSRETVRRVLLTRFPEADQRGREAIAARRAEEAETNRRAREAARFLPTVRQCEQCGVEYVARQPHSRYCGANCRSKARYWRDRQD